MSEKSSTPPEPEIDEALVVWLEQLRPEVTQKDAELQFELGRRAMVLALRRMFDRQSRRQAPRPEVRL